MVQTLLNNNIYLLIGKKAKAGGKKVKTTTKTKTINTRYLVKSHDLYQPVSWFKKIELKLQSFFKDNLLPEYIPSEYILCWKQNCLVSAFILLAPFLTWRSADWEPHKHRKPVGFAQKEKGWASIHQAWTPRLSVTHYTHRLTLPLL